MVLEEKIAEEWLSDDDDDEDGEGVDKKNLTPNKGWTKLWWRLTELK